MANIKVGQDPIQKFYKAQSTHHSIQDRLNVYNKLGLNKPGFWVDWKQRTLNENSPDDEAMPTAAQNPVIKTLDPYDTQATNYTSDPPVKREITPIKPPKVMTPGAGPKPYVPPNLPEAEKQMVWSQVRNRMRNNAILGVDGSDFSIAEKNYMDIDIVQQMNADPTKFMGQALQSYYLQKRQTDLSDWNDHATNFEKMMSMASATKKKNLKVVGRFIAPNEAQKATLKQTYINQTKGGGPTKSLNVQAGGYYSAPLYISPFG